MIPKERIVPFILQRQGRYASYCFPIIVNRKICLGILEYEMLSVDICYTIQGLTLVKLSKFN